MGRKTNELHIGKQSDKDKMFESVENQLHEATKIVFLTGAGMSQASGIPTFRGKDGYWKTHDPMKLATTTAFKNDPRLVWEWYYERRKKILEAKPNKGHFILAEIGKYRDIFVITQNVDGFHQLAGSKKVVELHGSIFKTKCTVCDFRGRLYDEFPPPPPLCNLGHILRPDIVWFDEDVSEVIWKQVTSVVRNCDVLFVVGTSLVIDPANELPVLAKKHGAKLIEINTSKTRYTTQMDLSIRDTAVNALTALKKFFSTNRI